MMDMLGHIPTMFLMIIAASATLALSVGWVSRKNSKDGLRIWACALLAHTAAFILLALRDKIPDQLSIVLANILLSCVYAMLLAAIVQFQQRQISSILLWGPPLFTGVTFSLLLSNIHVRIVIGGLVFTSQILIGLVLLVRSKTSESSRGRDLLIAGFALMVLVFGYRISSVIQGSQSIQSLMSESAVQLLTFLGAFVALLLSSNGFLMMIMERADERIRLTAMSDYLTGTWNRARTEELAKLEIDRLVRYRQIASLVMIDLDHFKNVNDDFGHSRGDAVLIEFCNIVKTCIRSTDVFGRWGGEEFLLLLPSTNGDNATQLAERIRKSLEQHKFVDIDKVTASFGIAVCKPDDTLESWVRRADQAMYRAKKGGRNRVESESAD